MLFIIWSVYVNLCDLYCNLYIAIFVNMLLGYSFWSESQQHHVMHLSSWCDSLHICKGVVKLATILINQSMLNNKCENYRHGHYFGGGRGHEHWFADWCERFWEQRSLMLFCIHVLLWWRGPVLNYLWSIWRFFFLSVTQLLFTWNGTLEISSKKTHLDEEKMQNVRWAFIHNTTPCYSYE